MGKLSVESFTRLAWYSIDQVIRYLLISLSLPYIILIIFIPPLPFPILCTSCSSLNIDLSSQTNVTNQSAQSAEITNSSLSGYDLYRCGATTVLFLFFSHKTTIHIQQMQGLWQSSLLISLLFMVIFKKKSCLVFSSSFYTV